MKKFFLPGLGIFIFLLIIWMAFSNSPQDQTNSARQSLKTENKAAGNYVEYSSDNLSLAQSKGRAVLYFWAVWCPTCRALDKELNTRGGELPDDVTILRVNFDTEKELKRKYNITQQHTLVLIDKEGNEVKKWIGGNIDLILQELENE